MLALEQVTERSTRVNAGFEGGATMHDSFSEGGVFYGRTMLILSAVIILAALARFI